MYTWGYIKNVTLAKLDLDEGEANVMNLLSRFMYYANEAIVQISSTVKPKHTFYEIVIDDTNLDTLITMPSDFIAFGDDVNYVIYDDPLLDRKIRRRTDDEDFTYVGNNQICFHTLGKFFISYDALWIFFTDQSESTILEVPVDILNCLPSYIASQCMKIDDQYKASELRNEYEILLARINDTNYKNTKTFKIEGDW